MIKPADDSQTYVPAANHKVFLGIVVAAPILGTLLAIALLWERMVGWTDLTLLLALYVSTAVGMTAGFHRMLTHRSFRAHPAVKLVLLILGSMAINGPPIEWTATHLKHHAQADREDDPHSPRHGLFHAHVGWLFKERFADPQQYCKYLFQDQVTVFVNRTFLLWSALSLLIPFLIGGWTGLLWGGLVRVFISHHVIFAVNSICHTFGRRDYETTDRSHNQWLIAVLAFGEGWHNNHHAFPRSAFHGLRWWQVDIAGYVIRALERLRLVREVCRVSPAQQARYSSEIARPLAS